MNIIATMRSYMSQDELCDKVDYLFCQGIRAFRFNMAKVFEKTETLENVLVKLKYIKKQYPDIKIMLDIPYPGQKLRIVQNVQCKEIYKGKEYLITFSEKKDSDNCENIINIYGGTLSKKIEKGEIIYYDMGQGGFKIVDVLSNHKFIVIAQNNFSMYNKKSISVSEIKKCDYGLYLREICKAVKIDEIAFSFVESAQELEIARALQKIYNFEIVSKIETQKGIENIENIIENSDIIMLGRGDLCLYSDYSLLLEYQKEICKLCKLYKKKIYFATGYLESLETNIIPTRSEIIDLSFSVLLQPDALILNAAVVASSNIASAVSFINKANIRTKEVNNII